MICQCGTLIKKRTLLDGIKQLKGQLIVFRIEADLYINQCCFATLMPSLYMFIDKSWLLDADILTVDPNAVQFHPEDMKSFGTNSVIQKVFKIQQKIIDQLTTLVDDQFIITYIASARLISSEYRKVINSLNLAHQRNNELEHSFTALTYQHASAVHDNKLLAINASIPVADVDSEETPREGCDKCKNIKSLRENIKDLRLKSHDQINKLQYEIEIGRKKAIEIQTELSKLREENANLKEINKSLYMSR